MPGEGSRRNLCRSIVLIDELSGPHQDPEPGIVLEDKLCFHNVSVQLQLSSDRIDSGKQGVRRVGAKPAKICSVSGRKALGPPQEVESN